jgi:nucleoside-triphosphatase THEP1
MVIVITGAIGIGKTTVCEKVIKIVQSSGYSCGGVLTYKAEHGSLIALDIQTGEGAILASADNTFGGPRTPRYSFNPEAMKFGIRAINKALDSDVLIIDELGHLELDGEGFAKSLELVKTGKVRNAILVIRKRLLPDFLARLGNNLVIFETTISTRDQLPRKICSSLIGNLLDSASSCASTRI